jgi:hypothetical protein
VTALAAGAGWGLRALSLQEEEEEGGDGGGGGRRRPVDGENGITEDGVLESIVVWYVP